MKNKLLNEFKIGDKVAIYGEFKLSYDKDGKKIPIEIPFKTAKWGVVCGASHKYLGTYKHGTIDHETGYEEDQAHLSIEKVITIWRVTLGLLNTPLDCLTEQLKKTEIDFYIPIRYYSNKEI